MSDLRKQYTRLSIGGLSPYHVELAAWLGEIDLTAFLDRLNSLRSTKGDSFVGRRRHFQGPMLRAYLLSYRLDPAIRSTNDLIKNLRKDPQLRYICGFVGKLPHRVTFNRFYAKLAARCKSDVYSLSMAANAKLAARLPGYGLALAIDSTNIYTHARPHGVRPTISSDSQASWTAKAKRGNPKKKEWHYGYKFHLVADARYGIPIAGILTTAKRNDTTQFEPLLKRARHATGWVDPAYVAADKGYDSYRLYALAENRDIAPVIPKRRTSKLPKKQRKTRSPRDVSIVPRDISLWNKLYATRQSVERVYKSMKQSRRLNAHYFRGMVKIQLHAALSMLAFQVTALRRLQTRDTPTIRWQVEKM